MGKFDNQVALITGGSSGIGLTTAQLLASEGATVIITGRNPAKLEQALQSLPASATAVQSDIGSATDRESLIRNIGHTQKIDILVFCSGIVRFGTLLNITEDQFDEVINTNTKGVLFLIKEAVKQQLFNREARIVIVTSSINKGGFPGFAAYASSKGALLLIVKTLARELYPSGIRVNAVCPGATNTAILSGMGLTESEQEVLEKGVGESLPYGARANPIDIAQAISFLASHDSRFAIGTEFIVDGGQTC